MRPYVLTAVAKNDKHILEVNQRQVDQDNSFRAGRKTGEKRVGYLLISTRKINSSSLWPVL